MRKFNKIISAVLVGAMVFSMTACGNEEASTKNTESSQQSVVTSETTAATETEPTETEPEVYTVTYPVDTDYTITYFGMYPFAFDDLTKPYTAGLIERTGINLEPTIVEQADANNAYNLLLTEETLPNLITRGFSGAQLAELYEDGAIWDLAPYLEEYAPDYWAFLNAEGNEDLLRLAKDDEGRILAVDAYVESERDTIYYGPVIRKDWLEECGLPMPVTMEDWEKTLEVFKEKYGASFSTTKGNLKPGLASGTGAMGGVNNGVVYVDDNDKIQHASLQPEFKAQLEFLARWIEKDLFDVDTFTQSSNDVRQKVMDGKVGISIASPSQMYTWNEDAKAEGGNGGEWVGLSYPRTEAGAPTSMIHILTRLSGQKTAVTTSVSEEDLKVVLAWINYGFTEEGFRYQNFGEEGVAHTVDAQGNVTGLTDAVKGSTLKEFAEDYIGAASIAVCGIQSSDLIRLTRNESQVEAASIWTENTVALDHLAPTLPATADGYTDKWNASNGYINETVMKFLMGEEDLANFDAFVQKAYDLGMKFCLEVKQQAYDAYLAR